MGASGRESFVEWYLRNRRRSRMLFDSVAPAAYAERPISLRNPICFYEGHIPALAANLLLRGSLKQAGVDDRFDALFARGIDPEDERCVEIRASWPSRDDILDYGRRVDERVLDALSSAELEGSDDPVLRGGQIARMILEHEEMHHETVCYLLHRLPRAHKRPPEGAPRPEPGTGAPRPARITVPAGTAALGLDPDDGGFGWDNEFPSYEVAVPTFEIDVHDVTNHEFMEFVEASGYDRPELWRPDVFSRIRRAGIRHPPFWEHREGAWFWRGLFEDVALPAAWPAYVSWAEADAYARWRGQRLPTEPEYHRAAYGSPAGGARRYPWGNDPPDATRGAFDFSTFDPVPAGARPAGASAFGVQDLAGNGWEWTRTPFAPFPGFRPMPAYPGYSADFFDGRHFVLKGASPVTARHLVRPTFRNWFRDTYPHVYATFRLVSS